MSSTPWLLSRIEIRRNEQQLRLLILSWISELPGHPSRLLAQRPPGSRCRPPTYIRYAASSMFYRAKGAVVHGKLRRFMMPGGSRGHELAVHCVTAHRSAAGFVVIGARIFAGSLSVRSKIPASSDV